MKKLLLFFFTLLACFQANAQYRFYAGIQGGPKLSFSNTTLYNGRMAAWEINHSASGKLKYQFGVIAGYNFRNPRFSLEGGFSVHDHAMIAQFEKWDQYPAPPEIKFAFSTEQIHLVFKTTLNYPESKIRIKLSMGGAWVLYSYGVEFEDLSIFSTSGRGEPYLFDYADDRPEYFTFWSADSFYGFGRNVNEKWLLLTGLEAETTLLSRLNLAVSLQYQTSIRPVQAIGFEYNYNYQRGSGRYGGAYYEPMQYGSMQSKAEAINLNVGLTYAFGKRQKNS